MLGPTRTPRAAQERAFLLALGHRMAGLRRERSLTQAVLSARAGLSVEFISRLENGHENPTILTLRSLAQGLGCRLEALMAEAV